MNPIAHEAPAGRGRARAARVIFAWATALIGLLTLAGVTARPAAAAADFISEPAVHAELDTAPGWVMMAFDFPLDPSTAKILVLNSDGENVTTGELAVEYTNVRVQLQDDLPKGTYTVQYRVSRRNGEPLGGSFQFAYGQGTWSPSGESTWKGSDKEPPVMKNPDPNATTAMADPSATATPSPSATPTPSQTATPTVSPTPTPSEVPASSGSGSGALGWVVLVGALAVVASAVGAWLYRRRRG